MDRIGNMDYDIVTGTYGMYHQELCDNDTDYIRSICLQTHGVPIADALMN